MDLQAILDDSDSSSGGDDVGGVAAAGPGYNNAVNPLASHTHHAHVHQHQQQHQKPQLMYTASSMTTTRRTADHFHNHNHNMDTSSNNNNMDLEQILREEDDDDDDDGDQEEDLHLPPSSMIDYGGRTDDITRNDNHNIQLQGWNRNDNQQQRSNGYNDNDGGAGMMPSSSSHRISATAATAAAAAATTRGSGGHHNPEDWAVLQKILNEDGDDDDDDGIEDYGVTAVDGVGTYDDGNNNNENNDASWLIESPTRSSRFSFAQQHGAASGAHQHSNNNDTDDDDDERRERAHVVDAILRSSEEDDDDENDHDNNNNNVVMAGLLRHSNHNNNDDDPPVIVTTTSMPISETSNEGRDDGLPPSFLKDGRLESPIPRVPSNDDDDDDDDDANHIDNSNNDNGRQERRDRGGVIAMPSPSARGHRQHRGGQVQVPVTDSAWKQRLFYSSASASNNNRQYLANNGNDAAEEDTSNRAMSCAQAYERKLLRPGHREIVSPLQVKRRLKPKIELSARHSSKPAATSSEQQQASSASAIAAPPRSGNSTSTSRLAAAVHHTVSRYNFAGIIENKTMSDISTSLQKHAEMGAKVLCGLPTCLTFNSKFIAIGTQLGIILVYDLFEVLRQRLGASGFEDNWTATAAGSITSLDLSVQGDMVVAGYTSGIVVLWDTIKGNVLRSVHDAHPSPITAARFLTELKVVTVDAGGLVNKLNFSKNILWSNYSVETECLLDGTAGQILAMDVLVPFSTVDRQKMRPEKQLAPVLRKLTLMALSSERSSFVVAVEPVINVLHRWARPPAEKSDVVEDADELPIGQEYLPCLSWGWALVNGGDNVVMPILARAWGCCIQLLCASFPTLDDENTSEASNNVSTDREQPQIHWPAFGVHEELDAMAPVVALNWLNDRSLIYLTVTNEFTLVDTVMMTLQERLDFSGLRLVYAEFTLSRSVASASADPAEMETEPVGSSCTTFLNSIRCSDDRLMILCQDELKCASILLARQRISSLEEDGEWLEALALALDHYESTVVSQEDRRRDPNGKKDLSKHPEFSHAKSEEEEWIAKLLIRYLNLAVENFGPGMDQTRIDLAQSHFQMLAGVCVEFCVVTRRLDLLFGPIFRRFQSAGYTSVFLDVLEPYVLSDRLAYISPEVMSFFVEHYKASNGISTVERCLLHMDCTIMDFDSIVSLLRKNSMYTALIYVFNQGLDDYVTPLEILLERVFEEADEGRATLPRRRDGVPQTDFEKLGYKTILYLRSCFKGKTFPQDDEITPESRQHTLKPELMNFLLRANFSPSPLVRKAGDQDPSVGHRSQLHPYMRILLMVDARMMLETVSFALDAQPTAVLPAEESSDNWAVETTRPTGLDKDQTLRVLSAIILPESDYARKDGALGNAVNAFLDFTAKYIMNGAARVDRGVTFMVITRMADRFAAAQDAVGRQLAQRQVLDLLSALPRDSYDPDKVLDVIHRSGIHRAALLLHQQVASSWLGADYDDLPLRARHFGRAIECYIEDDDVEFRREVFAYVRKECSCTSGGAAFQSGSSPVSLSDILFTKLPALVRLDALMTARLVAELFVDQLDRVVAALESDDGGEAQFWFLQAIISGELVQVDPVAGSILNYLSMEHHHKYLALTAKLHPEMVYEYLSTHDNYRPEECLKLCQEHDIADASAYLLERMGNVTSALQLILQTLEGRMMSLKRTIRGMGVDAFRKNVKGRKNDRASPDLRSKQTREVEGVKRILVVALDLCERNSCTFSTRSEHGSQLWFNVLDRLINAKGFLRLSKEQPAHAHVMSGVLSELLRLTMQRMVSSVPLTDLVRKVTSDHSGSRLGDLREMVESLLGTYGFELNVFTQSVTVFHDDTHEMRMENRRLQVQGSQVKEVMSTPLTPETGILSSSNLAREREHCALSIGSDGNATFVDTLRYSQGVQSGLTTALSRLRSRRGDISVRQKNATGGQLSGLSMMSPEIEPDDVFADRAVGLLGDAEHRGRLNYFQ